MVGAFFHERRVSAVGHDGAGRCVAVLAGNFCRHCLRGRALEFAAEGHQNAAGADGGVEALGKPPAGADIEIGNERAHPRVEVCGYGPLAALWLRQFNFNVLWRAVAVQKRAREVNNLLAVPGFDETRRFRHNCDRRRLQIFDSGKFEKLVYIIFFNDNGHALLTFGNRKLCAVQTLVFLGNLVQINIQPIGKFANGDGHAARAEVVAALNKPRGLGVSEQALELALLGGVALLHLCTAALQRVERVCFGGAGRAAAAVPPRAPAQKQHNIAGGGRFSADVFRRGRTDDSADFHVLGEIAGVIKLIHNAGRKTNLVSVGAVACGGGGNKLFLRQLACERLRNRLCRVGGTRYAHGGIDVGPAGKRVADRAADAGRCAAEGLNLSRVIVGFIFKKEQPFFNALVGRDVHLDGAGVNFLALI